MSEQNSVCYTTTKSSMIVNNSIRINDMPKAILLTNRDPFAHSIGGQAAFAKSLLKAFGSSFAVTSHCDDDSTPSGKWCYRPCYKRRILFFSRGKLPSLGKRVPFVPLRVRAMRSAMRYMAGIRRLGIYNIFIDSPELLFAASRFQWDSVCYRSAGVNNPVSNSRYSWARFLGRIYEHIFVEAINRANVDVFLASADTSAIDEFLKRTNYAIDKTKVYQFPTRVDTTIFHPMPMYQVRQALGLPLDQIIVVSIGRLSWVKGWDLLLSSIQFLNRKNLYVKLIFVGDGEDRARILKRAQQLKIGKQIRITGFVCHEDVSKYINASDLCVVGSYREGWSLAMLEMLACGKPIVSTNVSGTRYLIMNGKNGYVVNDRNPYVYANTILKALKLKSVQLQSLQIANRYSLKTLVTDIGRLWPPLKS